MLPQTLGRPAAPSRLLVGVAALPLAFGLTACSGDSDDEGAAPTRSESAEPGAPVSGCRADVRVTGAVQTSWDGRAKVRLADPEGEGGGPDAVYTTQAEKAQLSVYSAGEDFPTAATFTAGKRTFSARPDDTDGIETRADGSAARVDVPVYDVDGKEARLRAEFDCSKGRGSRS